MREFMRDQPEGGGNWFAIDRQGNLIPFPELPPEKSRNRLDLPRMVSLSSAARLVYGRFRCAPWCF